MTTDETARLLAIITFAYNNFDISDEKVLIWQDVLSDYPFEKAEINLRKHIHRSKYPPTPAEIRGNADPDVFVDFEQQKLDTIKRLQEHDELLEKMVPPPWRLKDGTSDGVD